MAKPKLVFVESFGIISALGNSLVYILYKNLTILGGTSSPIFDFGPRFDGFKIEFKPYCLYGES